MFSPDDSDGDGLQDTTEVACGSDPVDATSVPERIDTTGGDDKDGLFTEPPMLGDGVRAFGDACPYAP